MMERGSRKIEPTTLEAELLDNDYLAFAKQTLEWDATTMPSFACRAHDR